LTLLPQKEFNPQHMLRYLTVLTLVMTAALAGQRKESGQILWKVETGG